MPRERDMSYKAKGRNRLRCSRAGRLARLPLRKRSGL